MVSESSRFCFCPYDGTSLVDAPETAGGDRTLPTCPTCGFVDYGNAKPCVAVLVENERGELLLVRRGIPPAKEKWDIPGGFIDAGETAEEAAIREICEETGLHVGNPRYLMSIADTYGERSIPTINFCFLTDLLGGRAEAASDAAALGWFGPDTLPTDMAFVHQHAVLDAWRRLNAK